MGMTIGMKDYYEHVQRHMHEAISTGRKEEAEYCALHLLMAIESQAIGKDVGKVQFEKLEPNKVDIEQAMELLEKQKEEYLKKDQKDSFMSYLTEVIIFFACYKLLQLSLITSLAIAIGLFVIEIFINKKTKMQRFKSWQMKRYQNKVSDDLVSFNKLWLTE